CDSVRIVTIPSRRSIAFCVCSLGARCERRDKNGRLPNSRLPTDKTQGTSKGATGSARTRSIFLRELQEHLFKRPIARRLFSQRIERPAADEPPLPDDADAVGELLGDVE